MLDPRAFAEEWVAAWSRKDAEAVLAHYADHAVFTSPKAEQIVGQARLESKAALAAYWRKAMEKIPTLHFELVKAHWDRESSTLAIVYVADLGGRKARACEVMRFEGELVVEGEAFYGAAL